MMIRTLSICLLTVSLGACASLNSEQRLAECQATNWQNFGVNDGRLGVPATDRSEIFADCAELGHQVDIAAYQAGRTEGLQLYCTVENGYQVGYEGRRYDNVCPPSSEVDFLQGFNRGREERPAIALSPSIGIGIGSRSGVSIGLGVGLFNYFAPYRFKSKRYGFGYYPRRYRYRGRYGYRYW
ncbi:MAG: DUF2799 domain-containing protein [Pseudomonadota bacterium]